MPHPFDEFSDIGFRQWAALGRKLGGREVVDQALRDEIKFVRKDDEISIESGKDRQVKPLPVPGVNELFELTIDGDADITPEQWRFEGPEFPSGKWKFRVRLLDLGCCS